MTEQALTVIKSGPIEAPKPMGYAPILGSSPETVIANATSAANALKSVLKSQGLISNIQGKEYPRCEAWTLLGTMVGVFPVLCWTKPVELGWEARVEARTRDGAIVGAAEAQCLRSESNWAKRDDFALRSMAQTRATAKALRMPLGFVMTLAGYEPTPAEEMASGEPQQPAGRVPARSASYAPVPPTKTPASGVKPQPGVAQGQATPKAGDDGSDALRRKAKFLQIIAEKQWGLYAWLYAVSQSWILDTERLEDAPPEKFPKTEAEMAKIDTTIKKMLADAAEHGGISQAEQEAYDMAHLEIDPETGQVHEPSDNDGGHEPWMDVVLPFGKQKGMTLGELAMDQRNYLFGMAKNYEPKPYNGRISDKDKQLRKAMDQALSWMEENK